MLSYKYISNQTCLHYTVIDPVTRNLNTASNYCKICTKMLLRPITECLVESLLTALNDVRRKSRFVALLNS